MTKIKKKRSNQYLSRILLSLGVVAVFQFAVMAGLLSDADGGPSSVKLRTTSTSRSLAEGSEELGAELQRQIATAERRHDKD